MKAFRFACSVIALLAILSLLSFAQDPNDQPAQPSQQRGSGQRGGRGQWGGAGGMMGRGVIGTVTEIATDHFTVKTDSGDTYTIHYSVNTRIMKSAPRPQNGQEGIGAYAGPPQTIKAADIKVGDAIMAAGEIDANAKSVGAVAIFQIDPERAKQMREMQANYGKTWLMGRVTAINEAKVTIQGGPDNATRTFTADENTTFRKRRDPITLADIQPGDMVRVEGSVKNGEFVATTVVTMGPPPNRADAPSAQAPPQ